MAAPCERKKLCDVCGKSFQVLKRCKSCKMSVYCSKECQIQDWPSHKLKCTKKIKSLPREDTHSHRTEKSIWDDSNDADELSTNVKDLQVDGEGERTDKSKQASDYQQCDHGALSRLSCSTSKEEIQHGERAQSSDGIETVSSATSTEDSFLDPVTISVKTSKQKHSIRVDKRAPSGDHVMQHVASSVRIPLGQLKLIHKGKVMTADTIMSCLANRAVFQAIGEVGESEEGLRPKDISRVMDQIKVDRNTAIKALRQTGDVIDAILYLGNK